MTRNLVAMMFLLVFLSLVRCEQRSKFQRQLAGGWSDTTEEKDSSQKKAISYSKQHFREVCSLDSEWKVKSVLNVKRQVVAGLNYNI
jgi:hypothetical protein